MKLLLVILFVLVPRLLFGAVAYDNAASTTGDGETSLTISGFAVGATNPLILCAMTTEEFDSTTGVTFNSVAMTQVGSALSQDSSNNLSLWRLTGQSGTHDVEFTFSDTTANTVVGCVSFTGVDQTTPVGTPQTSFDFLSLPISITVPSGGLGFDVVGALDGSGGCVGLDVTASNTERLDACSDGGAGSSAILGSSTITATGTMSWDWVPGAYTLQIGVPINQATAAAASIVTRRRGQ